MAEIKAKRRFNDLTPSRSIDGMNRAPREASPQTKPQPVPRPQFTPPPTTAKAARPPQAAPKPTSETKPQAPAKRPRLIVKIAKVLAVILILAGAVIGLILIYQS